jgi:hypothetical protein
MSVGKSWSLAKAFINKESVEIFWQNTLVENKKYAPISNPILYFLCLNILYLLCLFSNLKTLKNYAFLIFEANLYFALYSNTNI